MLRVARQWLHRIHHYGEVLVDDDQSHRNVVQLFCEADSMSLHRWHRQFLRVMLEVS